MPAQELQILVADDSEGIRDLFTAWLSRDHSVETAADGRAAIEKLHDGIDVMTLDRDMPGPSGREVARHVAESAYDPHIVMVSSLERDFDLDAAPIDSYCQKPVGEDELRAVIDRYTTQRAYKTVLDEYFYQTWKVAALEAHSCADELANDDRYVSLRACVNEKRAEADRTLRSEDANWEMAFQSCTGGPVF
jgi:CheY-like chemotaxis protein